jgi:hypothetical protein
MQHCINGRVALRLRDTKIVLNETINGLVIRCEPRVEYAMNHLTKRVALLAFATALLVGWSSPAQAGMLPYPDADGLLSSMQTGGPFITPLSNGDNQWATPLHIANVSSLTLANATLLIDGQTFFDPGPGALENTTWNNSAQQWQYSTSTLTNVQSTFTNASLYVSLDPASTNIPIRPGFGLTTSDSVPAYSFGGLAPGQSVDVTILQDISPAVAEEFFFGDFAAQVVPEPTTLVMLSTGTLSLAVFRQRRRKQG